MSNDVVILGAARTPQGRIKGQLSTLPAVELGAIAIRAAVAQSGIDPKAVDFVILGQVLQAGAGQNPSRQAAVKAGLGWNVVSTMVGYPLGGIIVGFAIDQWLDTTPWVTIGLMFTAFAGAFLLVVRMNQNKK